MLPKHPTQWQVFKCVWKENKNFRVVMSLWLIFAVLSSSFLIFYAPIYLIELWALPTSILVGHSVYWNVRRSKEIRFREEKE